MKNPNGFGTITKESGNRRKPYRIRDDSPQRKTIGTFATREEAMIALAQYKHSPFDIQASKFTLGALFEIWMDKKAHKYAINTVHCIKSAWKHCKPLSNMRFRDIRAIHMQDCIDNCGCGYSTQGHIKDLFRHLDRLALEIGVSSNGYAQLLTSAPIPPTTNSTFSEQEIRRLWEIQDEPWVDSVLIYLYTGFRLTELLNMRSADVDLTSDIPAMTGGIKTAAGKDRRVPVSPLIVHLVRRRLAEGGAYLLTYNGQQVSKTMYYRFFKDVMTRIGATHKVHETRHTFCSRLDRAGANMISIKRIAGHKSGDVTSDTYVEKGLQDLYETILLLT